MGYIRGLYENQNAYGTVSGTTSLQIFGSLSNAKWNLGAGLINWYNATVSQVITFIEVGNLASGTRFQITPSTTSGQWGFNFLPLGLGASDTNTALQVRMSDQGTLTGWFTGFYD